MKKKPEETADDIRPEYEFDYSKARRGKYTECLAREGANIVVLEPDVARTFKDSSSVNEALRKVIELTRIARESNDSTPARTVTRPRT
jgi:hypothetical protein